jgi:putative glutamine amidotransferase
MRPLIGITTYREPARWGAWDQTAVLIPSNYVDSVQRAGGAVVLLPPDASAAEAVENLDAVIISGGADLDASLYGSEPHPTADKPRTERDASELAVYRAARERDIPVLGICRGLQVMAIAHGGALTQHLPDVSAEDLHRERPGAFTRHKARIESDTLASTVLGEGEREVNSSHHQAVSDPGNLRVSGYAEDETIEVCEDPAADFVLGVQWHPEADDDPALFDALIDAARRHQR